MKVSIQLLVNVLHYNILHSCRSFTKFLRTIIFPSSEHRISTLKIEILCSSEILIPLISLHSVKKCEIIYGSRSATVCKTNC
jgi:hypothetical protein